jgi:hypothetical protein
VLLLPPPSPSFTSGTCTVYCEQQLTAAGGSGSHVSHLGHELAACVWCLLYIPGGDAIPMI